MQGLIPESMLASSFSGRWDGSIEKDHRDGNHIIGQSIGLFEAMQKNKSNGTDLFTANYLPLTIKRNRQTLSNVLYIHYAPGGDSSWLG